MMIKLSEFCDVNKPIIEISTKNVAYIQNNSTILDCANKIIETGHRRLPVVDKKMRLEGIITTTDILHAYLEGIDLEAEISTIMVRDVIVAKKEEKIDYVLEKFKMSRRGGFPVLDKDRLVAIVTEHDMIKLLYGKEIPPIKAGEIMTKKPLFIKSYLSLEDALKSLVAIKMRRLPVMNSELKGIITSFDMLKYLVENDFNKESLDEPVEKIMRQEVLSVRPDESLANVIKIMVEKSIGGLLVLNGLQGIITERDIIKVIE